jgi:hypothetical protein
VHRLGKGHAEAPAISTRRADEPRKHALARRELALGDMPKCNNQAIVAINNYPDRTPVPAFGRQMVCSRCGVAGAEVLPNWKERESLTGAQWRN